MVSESVLINSCSIMYLGTPIYMIKHMVLQTSFYQIRRDLIKWTLHGHTLKQPICRPTLSLWPHLHQALACVYLRFHILRQSGTDFDHT